MRRWSFRKIKEKWDDLKASHVEFNSIEPPTTIKELDYTTVGGVWSLKHTSMFPKTHDTEIPKYSLGLTNSFIQISGVSDAWTQHDIDVSSYVGATVRIVFKHVAGPNYTGDVQLDAITLGTSSYSFENTGESWETTTVNTTDYISSTWSDLIVGTTTVRWNVDTGGTPSGNTGRTDAADGSYYVYSETSSTFNATRWLRSPEIVVDGDTLTFFEARLGGAADLGTLDVYLDVIS